MEVDPIQAFLIEAHKKLNEVTTTRADLDKEYEKKRADIDAQILKWKRAIDGVSAVAESEQGDPADVEVSGFVDGKPGRQTIKFTDAVRLCLRQRGDKPASAPDVRDGLINLGFAFGKYAQPLVPIHNCLKRLVEQGEAVAVKNNEGQIIGYKWVSPIEQALAEEYPSYAEATGVGLPGYQPDMKRATEIYEAMLEADRKAAEHAAEQMKLIEQEMRQRYPSKSKKG
jgi:hypothetical protein